MPVKQIVDSSGVPFSEKETRNYAYSSTMLMKMPAPTWEDWTVSRAVNEGMKSNNWVYRCVRLIVSTFTQLQLRVYDDETGELVESPEVERLLTSPNSGFSRQDTFELIAAWMLLAGRAYFYYHEKNLWPVSPDRLSPVRDSALNSVLLGYSSIESDGSKGKGVKYKPEEIIPFIMLNPADPVSGLSPLMAASKHVDIDNEQSSFNKSAMQSRGELSGFISFDAELSPEQVGAYSERINERYSGSQNVRKIGVIGSGASYQRIAATPVEMDFRESSLSSRDKILSTFGVPPQLVGAQEASTYDNLRTSELILWRNTVLPFADDICDSLTFFFHRIALLKPGLRVRPDTTGIDVLRDQIKERADSATALYEIGTPISQVNRILRLGIEEFEGWDKPYNGSGQPLNKNINTEKKANRSASKLRETRNLRAEQDSADKAADEYAKRYSGLLGDQQKKINKMIDDANSITESTLLKAIATTRENWVDAIFDNYQEFATISADQVSVSTRDATTSRALEEYFAKEKIVLKELGHIEESTISILMLQIKDGLDQGLSPSAIKQNITDVSAFDATRALRIARTVTGTAQSIGQLVGAELAGATTKVWQSALDFNVRDSHRSRDGEEAPIDGVFSRIASSNGKHPRYPLDPNLAPGDRINCRCSLTFKID